MPSLSRTNNKKLLNRNSQKKFPVPSFQFQVLGGFSLIEIVLTIFLVLALLSILFTASSTVIHSRNSSLQNTAAKIATREIENLRNTAYVSLPSSGSISDPDLQKLPSGSATRTISDYQSSTKIKQVTITVNWKEKEVPRQLVMETLISENGL